MNNDVTEPRTGNSNPSQDAGTPDQQGLPDVLGKTIKVPEDQINAGSRISLPGETADFAEET